MVRQRGRDPEVETPELILALPSLAVLPQASYRSSLGESVELEVSPALGMAQETG